MGPIILGNLVVCSATTSPASCLEDLQLHVPRSSSFWANSTFILDFGWESIRSSYIGKEGCISSTIMYNASAIRFDKFSAYTIRIMKLAHLFLRSLPFY